MGTESIRARLKALRSERTLAWLRAPLRSLPSRIVVSVFGAALVTGLAVTWVSVRSTEGFLREKIDEKFPVVLRSSAERLEFWYAQRELDVSTFARSETVVDSLRQRRARANARSDELERYLAYVLEQFPQYETLFLLEPDGGLLMEVGAGLDLPEPYRQQLTEVRKAKLEPMVRVDQRRRQIVSAPVREGEDALASLHAVLRVPAIEEALTSEDLSPEGGLYVVSARGEVVLGSPGAPLRDRWEGRLPEEGSPLEVIDYARSAGEHVVGTALAFPRFGWSVVVEEPYDVAFAPVVATSRQLLGINLGIVLLLGAIAYQMARSITRPIVALSDGARRIAEGEVDVVVEIDAPGDELGLMVGAFNNMAARLRTNQRELDANREKIERANAQLVAQNQELQRASEMFQQLSITDELTKLHNHRYFQNHMPREIKRADRTGEALCLVLADIDDFKGLNDRYGHAVGDTVLREVAGVINENVREMDLLARYGGEEFAILLPRTDISGAVSLAEKIRLAISRASFEVMDSEGPGEVRVTASFGVALYRGDDRALFTDADGALYAAKGGGKDCVVASPTDD